MESIRTICARTSQQTLEVLVRTAMADMDGLLAESIQLCYNEYFVSRDAACANRFSDLFLHLAVSICPSRVDMTVACIQSKEDRLLDASRGARLSICLKSTKPSEWNFSQELANFSDHGDVHASWDQSLIA